MSLVNATAAASSAAAPVAAPAASLAQTALALVVVIAAIFAVAWVLRRVQNLRPAAAGALRIHGGLQVGARERVLWLKAGDQHLLIGVAPGRVQTLHVFDRAPEETPAAEGQGQAPNFAELLKKALGREPRS